MMNLLRKTSLETIFKMAEILSRSAVSHNAESSNSSSILPLWCGVDLLTRSCRTPFLSAVRGMAVAA
jgi:hypothetical protein